MFVIRKIALGIVWEWSRMIWSTPCRVISGYMRKNVFINNGVFKTQPI